jgi:predicted Zn-dependent protease
LNNRLLRPLVALLAAVMLFASATAPHAQRLSFIRDAEIESIIRAYATPLFQAAGLNPSAVEIYLVKDSGINAFVAGGQKLFLNTGLLTRSDSANQVIGVIAHEVGHIQGAHLARVHDALSNATAESIIAMVLGAAAAIASGRPDVGAAVALGGQDAAVRSFLAYSRTQEGAADAAAMRLLDATGQSSRGLYEFFDTLKDQELLTVGRQEPYLRTHPLSADRMQALEAHLQRSRHADAADDPNLAALHRRMLAKLHGFLDPPTQTFRRYPESDQSQEARYARAVAFHRSNDLQRAIAEIDSLIAERPQDPYFHELKGQILFERGFAQDSLGPYDDAVRNAPGEPLLRLSLARAQLATDNPGLLDAAVYNLRVGLARERDDLFAWRQLAIAYGRANRMGESSWALAEAAARRGEWAEARFHATKATQLLPPGAPERLQAEDILRQADSEEEKKG